MRGLKIVAQIAGHRFPQVTLRVRAFSHGVGGRIGPGGVVVTKPGWLVSWFPSATLRSRICRGTSQRVKLRVTLARAARDATELAKGRLPPIVVESAPFSVCD